MTDPTRPDPGLCRQIEPGLRVILAPNPSPMTFWGINTFLLGTGEVTVIDPGPDLPAHRDAILAALHPGERICRILVTHPHLDHSPLARPLAGSTGAEVLGFGPPEAGRSELMQALAQADAIGGGEGVDHGFSPDRRLSDGDRLTGGGIALEVIHTPGHFAGHLCLAWGDRLFTGDHVMGWASSLVSPPDGDMGAYMASLARLAARRWRIFFPAHGPAVTDPAARLAWLAAHRRDREQAILQALAKRPAGLKALTAAIYTDTPAALLPAAERNVFAHLVDLLERNAITAQPALSTAAQFALPPEE